MVFRALEIPNRIAPACPDSPPPLTFISINEGGGCCNSNGSYRETN